MSREAFTVAEAQISIWPSDANGEPVLSCPLVVGAGVENLTIEEELEEVVDRPSGVPYPIAYHGAEIHSFSFERAWSPDVTGDDPPADLAVEATAGNIAVGHGNAIDVRLQPNTNYVAVLVFQDMYDATKWVYRCYFGVTDQKRSLSGNAAEEGIRSKQSFRAQYYLV